VYQRILSMPVVRHKFKAENVLLSNT